MSSFEQIDKYMEDHFDENIEELSQLVAIPSIAAQNTGQEECAEFVGQMLKQRGFEVEVMPTEGAPIVYAERKGKTDKTLALLQPLRRTARRTAGTLGKSAF